MLDFRITYMSFARRITLLAFCTVVVAEGPSLAGTITGNVADYNSAQVGLANGVLVVPANVATYTATGTITNGSSFIVTLPSGFTFGTAPSLTTSGAATFMLISGLHMQSATFQVATADVSSGDTISLATFTLNGATALVTITPVASALPLTMQAVGSDASPLSFRAFASDVGAVGIFVGAIQFIDAKPPSLGTKFGTNPTTDSLTAVLSATAISAQTSDAATRSVQILSPNGMANQLSNMDTATVTMFENFIGIAKVFASNTSDCALPILTGSVTATSATIPNVPFGREIFFCVTGSGSVIQPSPVGFTNIVMTPGTSTDFAGVQVVDEFPGSICYFGGASVLGSGGFFGVCTGFATPVSSVVTDSQGHMLVSQPALNRVLVLSPTGTMLGALAPGLYGPFLSPSGIAVDSKDNIFVSDSGNNRVITFNSIAAGAAPQTPIITAAGLNLLAPTSLAVDSSDNLVVVDGGNNRVVLFGIRHSGNTVSGFSQAGSIGPMLLGSFGQFNQPLDVAVDSQAHILVADSGNNRIVVFRSLAQGLAPLTQIGPTVGLFGPLSLPTGIAANLKDPNASNKDEIAILDTGNSRVLILGSVAQGNTPRVQIFSSTQNGQLTNLYGGLRTGANGNILLLEPGNARLAQFSDSGTFLSSIPIP